MGYLALYRKYRPTNFDDVIDQNHITKTLINQIKNDKVGHAYLFCGSRGTGKTSSAKIFAKAINCLDPQNGSPCNKCSVCKAMTETNMDILEIDAASNNGVDEVRDLREKIKYPPVVGKYKVYIIDEVHMLSTSAFNALLKTIEEPPAHAVFILATTEVHKLPATILSRCMRFDFKLVSTEAIAKLIEKIFEDNKIEFDSKAVSVIARAGEGSVRDALSIADMVVSFSDSNVTFESVMQVVGSIEKEKLASIVQSMLNDDIGNSLKKLDEILSEGKSALVLSKEIVAYLRDLLIILTIPNSARSMVLVPNDVYEIMSSQASINNYSTIIRGIEKLSEIEQELRYSVHPKIVLETGILKVIHLDDLERRIKVLENILQNSTDGYDEKKTENIGQKNLTSKIDNNKLDSSEQVEKEKVESKDKEYLKIDDRNIDISNQKESDSYENRDLVFGELLRYLRKNKHMILYSICSEFEDVKVQSNQISFTIKDEGTMEILNNQTNRDIFTEFFKSRNMTYDFDYVSKYQIEESLKEKLGTKLIITE